jgi:hypothetical protein
MPMVGIFVCCASAATDHAPAAGGEGQEIAALHHSVISSPGRSVGRKLGPTHPFRE